MAIDRDAPRSEIVAYSTLSDALTFDRAASRYLRPIADWQEERNESGRLLTGEFSMPFAWIDRELFLHVASAGSSYEVTVNGKRAGYVQDGATPADFDITRLATEGKNRVTVTLFGTGGRRCVAAQSRSQSRIGRMLRHGPSPRCACATSWSTLRSPTTATTACMGWVSS